MSSHGEKHEPRDDGEVQIRHLPKAVTATGPLEVGNQKEHEVSNEIRGLGVETVNDEADEESGE